MFLALATALRLELAQLASTDNKPHANSKLEAFSGRPTSAKFPQFWARQITQTPTPHTHIGFIDYLTPLNNALIGLPYCYHEKKGSIKPPNKSYLGVCSYQPRHQILRHTIVWPDLQITAFDLYPLSLFHFCERLRAFLSLGRKMTMAPISARRKSAGCWK